MSLWPSRVPADSRVTCLSEPVYVGLVSVVMSSWGNEMSVTMVVANNMHHGSPQAPVETGLLAGFWTKSSELHVGGCPVSDFGAWASCERLLPGTQGMLLHVTVDDKNPASPHLPKPLGP